MEPTRTNQQRQGQHAPRYRWAGKNPKILVMKSDHAKPQVTSVRSSTWAAISFFALALASQAQNVPSLVNYQGRLSNPDGSPLPTADYTLTFNVYDAVTNGVLAWGPQVFDGVVAQGHGAKIPVVQGYFNVMLGPVDTTGRSLADAFGASNRFVEIAVSNRPPVAPRQQILSAPFAFQAGNSAKLAGYDWSAVFGTNDPVAGTISWNRLSLRQTGTNVGIGGVATSLPTANPWSSPSPTQPTSVSNLSVTLTTTGRPVICFLTAGVSSTNAHIIFFAGGGGNVPHIEVSLFRDGASVGSEFAQQTDTATASYLSPSSFSFIDVPTPGVHTYEVKAFIPAPTGGSPQLQFVNVRLVAFEL